MNKILATILLGCVGSLGMVSCGSKDPKNMTPDELINRMQELSVEIDRELAAGHQERAFKLMDELEEVKKTLQDKASENLTN